MGRNQGLRNALPGLAGSLKGVVLLVSLLLPDHTSAECQCNLLPVVRQTRGFYIENYAQQYIQNFTANITANLLNQSKFTYNLTAKLSPYTGNQSLGQFTLLGGLYNIPADRLASGNFLWLFTSNAATYNCQDQNVNMSTYITRCYFQTLEKQLQELATNWSYPLGVYQSRSRGNYTYVSVDYEKNSSCFCSTSSGFSYHVHLDVDPRNLSALSFNRSSTIGKVTERDVELSVDHVTSSLFGESYIHSELISWSLINNSTICIFLYFKGQYDPLWNNKSSNTSNTLSKVTGLYLEYLQTRLLFTNKPVIVSCTSYDNGTRSPCLTLPVVPPTNASLANNTTNIPLNVTDPNLQQGNVATNTTVPSTLLSTSSTPSQININSTSIANTSLPWTASSTTTTTGFLNTSVTALPTMNTTLVSTEPPTASSSHGNVATNTTIPSTIISTSSTPKLTNTASTSIANASLPSTVSSTTTTTGNQKLATTQFPNTTNSSTIAKSPLSTTLNVTNLSTPNGTQRQTNTTIPTKTTPFGQSVTTIASTLSNRTTLTTSRTFSSSSIKASTKVPATTPFDEDPFFKADVPVIKKIYNDKKLLSRFEGAAQGTSLTEQGFFYTIAIPAALGILMCSILCLACCQMDWIGLSDPKKNQY